MIVCPTLLSAFLACCAQPGPITQEPAIEFPETFMGWAFILEADLAAGRRAGTLAAEIDDAAALESIATSMRARLVGSGKFVEGQVAVEPNSRVAVTFVGKQGEAYDRLLKGGLTNPGRLMLYARALDTDAGAGGLAGERELFQAWRTAHPELPASAYDRVLPEDGGSKSGLLWRPDGATGTPTALRASSARPVVRADAGLEFRLVHEEQTPVGFAFSVGEDSLPAFTEYYAAHAGQELVPVVNGVARPSFVPEGEWDGYVRVSGGFDLEGIRGFLFGFSGEPLCAPLRFVEFGKRPLLNVKTDGIDPEVKIVPAPK